jgi:hypothetical protein
VFQRVAGHSSSFDEKRTLFDLELLYKDRSLYGHDPHVHKYLGVTHLSYVVDHIKKMRAENRVTSTVGPDVTWHLEQGRHYCELRADPQTTYAAEFQEQRWECMHELAVAATFLVCLIVCLFLCDSILVLVVSLLCAACREISIVRRNGF